MQRLEAFASLGPLAQLVVDKGIHLLLVDGMVPRGHHAAARLNFERAEHVLVGVVGIEAIDAQRGVGVALPAAAQVEFVVNATDAVVA